ncbi:hypothetical protein COOONC_01424, partial [Cooperia oncophora]
MDGQITSWFILYPDQIQVANPLMIMIFIPIFQFLVYPFLDNNGMKTTLLQRMAIGGMTAAFAFVMCGFVQLRVNKTLPDAPGSSEAFVSVINAFPDSSCNFDLNINEFGTRRIVANNSLMDDKDRDIMNVIRIEHEPSISRKFSFSSDSQLSDLSRYKIAVPIRTAPLISRLSHVSEGGKSYLIVLAPGGWAILTNDWKKPQKGRGQFALSDLYTWTTHEFSKIPVHSYDTGQVLFEADVLDRKDLLTGTYGVKYLNRRNSGPETYKEQGDTSRSDHGWSRKTVFQTLTTTVHTIAHENRVSILWQLPQYAVITVAEILISVSGLEFAYQE